MIFFIPLACAFFALTAILLLDYNADRHISQVIGAIFFAMLGGLNLVIGLTHP